MFTGIVTDLGTVIALERRGDAAVLTVSTPLVDGASTGDSIAVNGVCLTIARHEAAGFRADVMGETVRRTTIGDLRAGDPVNLELAATLGTRLGGHLVQGHVDGVATVSAREPAAEWEAIRVTLPSGLDRYVVEKGSVAFDGVSLTVAAVDGDTVTVGLIPETLRRTTWGRRRVGDRVNVEVDILAKHVERLLAAQGAAR